MSKTSPNITFTQADFEKLFKEHFTPLCYFAQKYIKDNDASKEIVHDVFINLWNKIDTLDPNKAIKSYLFTSVHNRCLNYIRDNKKFDQDELTLERLQSAEYWDSTDSLVTAEMEDIIADTINALPEACKKIFILSRNEGLKYSEIADKLGISIKTVETQISKALKILRENLKEYMPILIFLAYFFNSHQGKL